MTGTVIRIANVENGGSRSGQVSVSTWDRIHLSLSLSLQPFIVNLIVSIGPGRKPRMTKRRSIKMNQNEAGMDVS